MSKCFVIQPFDRGKFDKRFDDVIAPAIKAASLEPYRIDCDPSVSVLIDQIHSGIRSSRACVADITTDNPNVWYELGYAIASQREVVLICSNERTTNFPFDVAHRAIIRYSNESLRDFEELKEKITTRLSAVIEKEGDLNAVANMSPVAAVHGLEQFELATLVTVAQNLDGGVSINVIEDDMEKAGFTRIATTLGIRRLIAKAMVVTYEERGSYGPTITYGVTEAGVAWLFQNRDNLKLRAEPCLQKQSLRMKI